MGWFKKNPDPITDRSRDLNAKISALESKIQKLAQELEPGQGPRWRSTAYPAGKTDPGHPGAGPPKTGEPVFEKVDQNPFQSAPQPPAPPPALPEKKAPRNFPANLWERLKREFQGPATANPKLVSYLAAGSIQGLRPLRYEKRVARNRCIALAVLLLLVSLGIFYALEHRR